MTAPIGRRPYQPDDTAAAPVEEAHTRAALVASTVRKIECFEVLCAGCGKDAFEQYEGIPHFDSTVEAVKDLEGWVWADPERPVCPRCHVAALCAAHGHVWGNWHLCGCRGRIPDHASACRRHRYCERDHEGRGACSAMQEGDRHEHAA